LGLLIADGLLDRSSSASDFHYQHSDPDWLNAGLRHLLLLGWRYQRGQRTKQHEVALHPSVAQALRLLGQQDAPEDLGALALRCGVRSSYLSRMFRKQIGVSVTRYRNSVRLARFWEEYRQPEQRTLIGACSPRASAATPNSTESTSTSTAVAPGKALGREQNRSCGSTSSR
ncbi:MAG: hypothetical protein OSA48_11995, partial [Akkermansiaceae bacterium]|nr:hypothetical protein [Akkermansiaceae bacterium]